MPQKTKSTSASKSPQTAPFNIGRVDLCAIRNFHFKFTFTPAQYPGTGQWVFLLGPNGTGKTTLIKTLALTLSSSDVASAVLERFSSGNSLVRQGDNETAIVRVHLKSTEAEATLYRSANADKIDHGLGHKIAKNLGTAIPKGEINRLREAFDEPTSSADDMSRMMLDMISGNRRALSDPNIPACHFIASYGSQRGTASSNRNKTWEFNQTDSIEGLFSPESRLIDVEQWLIRLKLGALTSSGGGREAYYEAIIAALKSLLPGVTSVDVTEDGLVMYEGRNCIPFVSLSDGYLTTAGWVLDMIARYAHSKEHLDGNFASTMTGLVLIDELDLHLHPEWQQEIVPCLRSVFPRLSFIVTSHSPLTVRNARKGEVFVLHKDESGHARIEQHDVPLGRVDNVLTSDLFGLESTLDPDTARLYALYLAGAGEETNLEAVEYELRRRLGKFASTKVERIALAIAADLIEKTPKPTDSDIIAARAKALELIGRLGS